ncbi:hypothetical protein SAMN05421770_106227 [Granulicella rosea]|uniref:Uncharacterized protein n=1 Tax=Granulicella rosea TaxID=474952 RepID=A0A239L950_9BACT|nr:hypothetical protein [Granulicella rosea]SNT27157.1 hypothetical protein SAMN05421770_106227 [Granulicella rosea]
MNRIEKLAIVTFGVLSAVIVINHADSAMHASIPQDMPANAKFEQSGFNLNRNEATGNWIACRPELSENGDWCRVTDQKGTVVFQGNFLPVDSNRVVPSSELQIATVDPEKMWVKGPVEQGPVPVISLANGKVLVPAEDRTALNDRWLSDPEEYKRATGQAE